MMREQPWPLTFRIHFLSRLGLWQSLEWNVVFFSAHSVSTFSISSSESTAVTTATASADEDEESTAIMRRRWRPAERCHWPSRRRQQRRRLPWQRAAGKGMEKGRGVWGGVQVRSDWSAQRCSGRGSAVTSVWGSDAGVAASGRKSPRQRTSSPQQPGPRTTAPCTSWMSAERKRTELSYSSSSKKAASMFRFND